MRKEQGLSLIELLAVISILLIILGITVQSLRYFQGEGALSDSSEKIINILRMAQSKTLASEGASQYGVYFDKTTDPHQYTLFKLFDSVSYNDPLRNTSSDEVYQISKSVEIYEINLGGGQEVVFSRLTGETANSGTVSLRLTSDNSKTRTIGIKPSGKITLGTESTPTDIGRLKDSRHVHIVYANFIDTTTEKLTLTFPTKTQDIPISTNMVAGQFYWEDEVAVDGQNQKIKIHTHYLNINDAGIFKTQFSVHRDMRFNDKVLKISISGDPSGNLIEYSADGLTTTESSVFVNDPLQWQ